MPCDADLQSADDRKRVRICMPVSWRARMFFRLSVYSVSAEALRSGTGMSSPQRKWRRANRGVGGGFFCHPDPGLPD